MVASTVSGAALPPAGPPTPSALKLQSRTAHVKAHHPIVSGGVSAGVVALAEKEDHRDRRSGVLCVQGLAPGRGLIW